ncbi:NADP-dependent oxidoreductase domain-containing protein [Jimgerdemannia flammicorona]|nr:NADP-dependent oxidoreductase domain-containing protein [Jimgerdemannia flammicorona]
MILSALKTSSRPFPYITIRLISLQSTAHNMSSYTTAVSAPTIPTADTKISLGGKIDVPPLALGCWSWGDQSIWGWTPDADADAKSAFDTSIDHGITFFDTAEVYGKGESERAIARYRNARSDDEKGKLIIASKFASWPTKLWYPSSLLNALNDSLKRLEMRQLDLYQIHGPVHFTRSIETIGTLDLSAGYCLFVVCQTVLHLTPPDCSLADALADAVDAGLTRTVGVSNYSLAEVKRMHAALQKRGIQLASNQIEYSLLRRLPETSGVIKGCHELGVSVLAYSPLAMGRLTGKYSAANPPPKGRHFSNYDMTQIEPLLQAMRGIAESRGKSVSAVALNWVICKGAIPLAGAKNAKQAEQNSQAVGWRLTEEEIVELEKHSMEGSNSWYWQHA